MSPQYTTIGGYPNTDPYHISVEEEAAMTTTNAAARLERREHELKCWPEYFSEVISGTKQYEVRKDDRHFIVGDTLRLREWRPKDQTYTGREYTTRITHKLEGGFGLSPGFCVLGLRPAPPPREAARLLPCPFCGDELRIGRGFRADGSKSRPRLLCMNEDDCLFMDFDTEEEAVAMANRRPVSPPCGEAAEAARLPMTEEAPAVASQRTATRRKPSVPSPLPSRRQGEG